MSQRTARWIRSELPTYTSTKHRDMPYTCFIAITAEGPAEQILALADWVRPTDDAEEIAFPLGVLVSHADLQPDSGGQTPPRDVESFVCDVFDLDREKAVCTCEFITAWSPPLPWLLHVSTLFPALAITLWYAEPNGPHAGEAWCSNGRIVRHYPTREVWQYNDLVRYAIRDPSFFIEEDDDCWDQDEDSDGT